MKFTVDECCLGCGMCAGICPAYFFMNEEGSAEAVEGEVASENAEDALQAMDSCPIGAIQQI